MEPKTLQFIYNNYITDKGQGMDIYCYRRIRNEAIKWIKQIEHAIHNNGKGMPEALVPYNHLEDWSSHTLSIIVWIKHFFNISEKDLK